MNLKAQLFCKNIYLLSLYFTGLKGLNTANIIIFFHYINDIIIAFKISQWKSEILF